MRVALLGVLALFIVSGIAASSASAAGPFWRVSGTRLGQGVIKQIKLQLKGGAVLETPEAGLTIECKNGVSEGSTIEGRGEKQGQGKGRIAFTQCAVTLPATGCGVVEPIITNPTKSYLANIETQPKIAEVFEPGQGTVFATVTITGAKCLQAGAVNVTGSAAAWIIPPNAENQEDLLVFPKPAIASVKHEGVVTAVALKALNLPTSFSAAFGQRLATNALFGAWET